MVNFQNKKTRFFKSLSLIACLMIVLSLSSVAVSADYLFGIPKQEIILWFEKDGKASLSYSLTINNFGQALDFIDIGLPNGNYKLSDVAVELDGQPISSTKISKADTSVTGLKYGVTIDNSAKPTPKGSSISVYVFFPQIDRLLFTAQKKADSDPELAGFQFMPNYFGSKYVQGVTDYSIRLVLPQGIKAEESIYYTPKGWDGEEKPESWISESGSVVYQWRSEKAKSSAQYTFGAAFPQSVLNEGVKIAAASTSSTSDGNGDWTLEDTFYSLICFVLPIFLIVLAIKKAKNRPANSKTIRLNGYLPPEIKTAKGEGIKRGLTAIEAAILLEQDLGKIISMIVFSLSKKGVIEITNEKPLAMNYADPLPNDLYEYETNFIEAVQEPNQTKRKRKMQDLFHKLILSVTIKMRGFNLAETKTYYQGITEKAWKQVQDAQTPEIKGELLDQNFGWTMLNEDPAKKTAEVFPDSPVYIPSWWWRMGPSMNHPYANPGGRPIATGSDIPASTLNIPSSGGGKTTSNPMPVLPGAMFARGITDSMRSLGEETVGSVNNFSNSVRGLTNPVYTAPSSSSGRSGGSSSSGGSSCACACACASCACACAGGGR